MNNNGKNIYLGISIVLGIVWPATLIFFIWDIIKEGFEWRIFNCIAIGVFWLYALMQYRKMKNDYEK